MSRPARLLAALLFLTGLPAEEIELDIPRKEKLVGLNLTGFLGSYIINGHYTTGWARYVETVPAKRLLDGIGIWGVMPKDAGNCDDFFRRCAEIGLRYVRWEVSWGLGAYRTDLSQPYRLIPDVEKRLLAGLKASKKHGVKVVILINAHQGLPCPVRSTLTRGATSCAMSAT